MRRLAATLIAATALVAAGVAQAGDGDGVPSLSSGPCLAAGCTYDAASGSISCAGTVVDRYAALKRRALSASTVRKYGPVDGWALGFLRG